MICPQQEPNIIQINISIDEGYGHTLMMIIIIMSSNDKCVVLCSAS